MPDGLRRGGGRTGGSIDSKRGGTSDGDEGRFCLPLPVGAVAECGEGAAGVGGGRCGRHWPGVVGKAGCSRIGQL